MAVHRTVNSKGDPIPGRAPGPLDCTPATPQPRVYPQEATNDERPSRIFSRGRTLHPGNPSRTMPLGCWCPGMHHCCHLVLSARATNARGRWVADRFRSLHRRPETRWSCMTTCSRKTPTPAATAARLVQRIAHPQEALTSQAAPTSPAHDRIEPLPTYLFHHVADGNLNMPERR